MKSEADERKRVIANLTAEIVGMLSEKTGSRRMRIRVYDGKPKGTGKALRRAQIIGADALIVHAAQNQGIEEEEVRSCVTKIFEVAKVSQIRRRQFASLCEYLINYGKILH